MLFFRRLQAIYATKKVLLFKFLERFFMTNFGGYAKPFIKETDAFVASVSSGYFYSSR